MMDRKIYGIALLSIILAGFALGVSGCIKSEAPNAEADILSFEIDDDLLFLPVKYTNNTIEVTVNGWADVTAVAPRITVTEGATIEPAAGVARDFTQPQKYTVYSEDGQWSKTYTVTFKTPSTEQQPVWKYSFEGVKYVSADESETDNSKKELVIIEVDAEGNETEEWQSGNIGALFTGQPPYTDLVPEGVEGNAVRLKTASTGPFGAMVGAPIAAGSLFLGEVDRVNLLFDPLKATHFGIPFFQEPLYLTGHYKYRAGDKVTDKANKELPGVTDTFGFYAVFFEVTDEVMWLDGTNVPFAENPSDQIIAVAQLTDKQVSDEWIYFNIPFVFKEGKSIDREKLENGDYRLSIVASSSVDADKFIGAVGSTLWLDELQLFCK